MHVETHSGLDIARDLRVRMIVRIQWRTRLIGVRGTSIWETGLQLKGAVRVSGEGLSQGVDLSLNLRHRPGGGTSL